MRGSLVIAGLAVLLIGVFLTTVFFWSSSAASSSSAIVNAYHWEMIVPVGISMAGAVLMAAGAKLKTTLR
jgi:hypothetical protein